MNYSEHNNKKRRKESKARTEKVTNSLAAVALRAIVIAIIIGGFLVAGAVFGAYMGVVESVPEIHVDEVLPDSYTSIIYDSAGNEIDRLHGDENREYAKLSEIPKYMQNAVVAVEDERFYTHNGVDLRGMARALVTNLKEKSLSEGASTITQQLVKNNILKDPSKKWRRKLQEQYIAIEYEKALTKTLGSKEKAKEYILEIYLNSIALGHGNNGVKAAAKYYFDKELSELSLAECATIAAITNNPSIYSPKTNPDNNESRRMKILNNMLEQGMITEAEFKDAEKENIDEKVASVFLEQDELKYLHSYFVDQLVADIAYDLQTRRNKTAAEAYNLIFSGGLKINSTIDMTIQNIMDEKFRDDTLFPESEFQYKIDYYLSVKNSKTGETTHHNLDQLKAGYVKSLDDVEGYIAQKREELMVEGDEILGQRYEIIPQPQAAMAIIDYHNGQVKALTGGRGDKSELGQRPLNRSTQAMRQPGSVFKVMTTYAPGIDSGKIAAATVVMDAPLKIGEKQFNNWWGSTYRGATTMRKGVETSANVVTVRTLVDHVGLETMWDYLMNFGFSTLVDGDVRNGVVYSDKTPAAALGGLTDGVTVMELSAAYGTIANGGQYNKPILYTTVLDHNNELLLDNTENEPRQVMKPQAAYIVTNIMEDVITGSAGTGHLAKFQNVKMPVSGKTGTTSDDKDLVFAGYTPYYVSAIWMGHDIPKKMYYSSSPHLRLWRSVMEEIHKDLEYKGFERPDGIVTGTVCAYSGLLPQSECGRTVTDMFVAGTLPTESCTGHGNSISICSVSGLLASEFCPEDVIEKLGYEGEDTSGFPTETCDIHTVPLETEEDVNQPVDEIPEWLGPGLSQPQVVTPPSSSQNQEGEWVYNEFLQQLEWIPNPNYKPPAQITLPTPTPELQHEPEPAPEGQNAIDNFDFLQ